MCVEEHEFVCGGFLGERGGFLCVGLGGGSMLREAVGWGDVLQQLQVELEHVDAQRVSHVCGEGGGGLGGRDGGRRGVPVCGGPRGAPGGGGGGGGGFGGVGWEGGELGPAAGGRAATC
jgi:hypothetical protein